MIEAFKHINYRIDRQIIKVFNPSSRVRLASVMASKFQFNEHLNRKFAVDFCFELR